MKGEKHFHEDVFQRSCAAGFGRTTDNDSERRFEFVRRILTENHEPEPAQVRAMFIRRYMCTLMGLWSYNIFAGVHARVRDGRRCRPRQLVQSVAGK